MTFLLNFISILCDVLSLAIFARAILSWISPSPDNMLVDILYHVTEPILAPLRRIIPRIGMIDFSPLVAIVLLQLIGSLLFRYLLP